jgi:hypothetical protein
VAESPHGSRLQADLVADEADRARADRVADLAVDPKQGIAHDRDRSVTGHAAAAHPCNLEPRRGHRLGDLLPAAVDDDGVLELAELAPDDGAAHLEYDHVVYSALILT